MALETRGRKLAPSSRSKLKPPPKVADRFYLSPDWRALMNEILAERGRRCEVCGRTGSRIYGDHVTELKDGGAPLDKRNIRLNCGSCHSSKTTQARARRHGLTSTYL